MHRLPPLRPTTTALAAPAAPVLIAAALAVASLAPAPAPARACGPTFPNRLLLAPDAVMDTLPAADFARELLPLLRRAHDALPAAVRDHLKPAAFDGAEDPVELAARQDLVHAMEALRVPGAQREDFLARLRKARRTWAPADLAAVDIDEFRLYLQGAAAARAGQCQAARAAWKGVLALPKTKRLHRGVWAAYMLGRSWAGVGRWACQGADEPAKAKRWFGKARELAAQGLANKRVGAAADRLGLGVESLGWEARAAWNHGDLDGAIRAYAAQASLGDGGALVSLQMLAAELVSAPPPALVGHAKSPARRALVTAWLLAQDRYSLDQGLPESQQVWETGDGATVEAPEGAPDARWLRALEAAGVRDVAGADRVAWLAYRAGHFHQAARWLKRGDGASPVALWVGAKLAIRRGKLQRGAKLLARAARGFGEDERWTYESSPTWGSWDSWGWFGGSLRPRDRTRAELAILSLVRAEMPRALELLARTNYWSDAAYVADRLVTTKQLKRFVDRAYPSVPKADNEEDGEADQDGPADAKTRASAFRYLLGRRLVRDGRAAEALPYFPADQRPALERYIAVLRRTRDKSLPPRAQAAAWWELAVLTRTKGMELMGSEEAPDWTELEGYNELDDAAAQREELAAKGARFAATKTEKGLAKRTGVKPYKRFHYRYLAAQQAARAAALLGPDDEAGDKILCVATRWLLKRDPEAARVYYRAFLKRNNLRPWAGRFGQVCPPVPAIATK